MDELVIEIVSKPAIRLSMPDRIPSLRTKNSALLYNRNLRMLKMEWFHRLFQMKSDLSSFLVSGYLKLIQESAENLI